MEIKNWELRIKNYMLEKEFRIRTYGKSELAMLYRPDLKEGNARRTLYNWMKRNEKLMAALDAVGYDPKRRTLTPREVAIIVDFIGEP